MELALITAKQVIELFILIFSGFVLYKKKLILSNHKKMLSSLLVNFVVPCMIINSYLGEYEDGIWGNLGSAFLYSILLCGIASVIGVITSVGISTDKKGIYQFAAAYSNAAYMGFPLVRALFGEEGILYASAFVTIFNIFLWSVGIIFFADKMNFRMLVKKVITCPSIIAVIIGIMLVILHIPVHEILATPISTVGSMTTPLSMIIIGVTVAETKILKVLRDKVLWRTLFVRHILIPAISLGLFVLLQFHGTAAMVTLILEAAPVAAITTILAIEYDRDYEFAAGTVVISTFCSIIMLPLYSYLLQILGI